MPRPKNYCFPENSWPESQKPVTMAPASGHRLPATVASGKHPSSPGLRLPDRLPASRRQRQAPFQSGAKVTGLASGQPPTTGSDPELPGEKSYFFPGPEIYRASPAASARPAQPKFFHFQFFFCRFLAFPAISLIFVIFRQKIKKKSSKTHICR